MNKMTFKFWILSLSAIFVIGVLSLILVNNQVNGLGKTIPGVTILTTSELTDPPHLIRFQYPADWNIRVHPWGNSGYNALNEGSPMVELRTPYEDDNDFRNLVSIAMSGEVFPKNATLSSIIDKTFLANHCECDINSSNNITNHNITLSGYPAYKLIYQQQGYEHYNDHDNDIYTIMETGALINGRIFFVQYRATAPSFPTYLPNVQKMIESLRIVSLPGATNATSFSNDSNLGATRSGPQNGKDDKHGYP